MNILVVSRFADRRGGADVYTESLAVHLARRGHAVSLLCHEASQLVKQLCNFIPVHEPDNSVRPGIWRFATLLYQRYWRTVIRELELPPPEAMICSLPLNMRDLRLRFPGVPLIYLPHSRVAPIEAADAFPRASITRAVTYGAYKFWERYSLIRATTTVRFSIGNVEELRSFYGLKTKARFSIIPAGIDAWSDGPRHSVHAPFQLVIIGRLVQSKNVHSALLALSSLRHLSWHLTVVGDGPERHQLEALTAHLKLSDHVTFVGFLKDLRPIYESSDMLLFPSIRESFGLVILEAMGFGVPTLAFLPNGESICTASDEIIEHLNDGVLVKDLHDFADQLRGLIAAPDVVLGLGERGRQKVIDRHLWVNVAAAWEELIQGTRGQTP